MQEAAPIERRKRESMVKRESGRRVCGKWREQLLPLSSLSHLSTREVCLGGNFE